MLGDKKGSFTTSGRAVKKAVPAKTRVAAKPRTGKATPAKVTKPRSRAAAASRRSVAPAYGSRAFTRTTSPHAGISITVQIPPLRRPKTSAGAKDRMAQPKRGLLLRALVLPAFLLAGSALFYNVQTNPDQKAPAKPVVVVERTQPDYRPLLPSAEKASTTKYDARRNLVTYNTTFSGARITVSQQPLPANFAKDPEALTKAADSIKATEQIETAKGMLWLATNQEAGNQLALFADDQVLVFVHSESKMDEASWKSFIELLKAKNWEELG